MAGDKERMWDDAARDASVLAHTRRVLEIAREALGEQFDPDQALTSEVVDLVSGKLEESGIWDRLDEIEGKVNDLTCRKASRSFEDMMRSAATGFIDPKGSGPVEVIRQHLRDNGYFENQILLFEEMNKVILKLITGRKEG